MAFEAFRQRLGSIIGGFDAAQAHRRLRGFRASRAHVNTLIAASGDTITARARWLVRNNGYAANAVESFASNVVGDGIKPSSTIADATKKEGLQALWLAWTDDADAEGLTDFYGLQRRAAREVFLSGEVFIRIRPRRAEDGLTVPLQLQMLPSEMLPLDMNRSLPGAGLIRQGIEFDGIGRRTAYHFLRRHPGDLTDPGLTGETVRVPAADVIHVLDPVEAGQLRGVSRFASFPKYGDSLNAAALVWSKAPVIIGAHETGPLIRSKNGFWLAIPTPAAGKSAKGGRITPGEWERRTGLRLRFIYRRRGPSLLVAEGRLNSKGRAVASKSKTRRGVATVPIFLLVPQVKLRKRLDLARDAERAVDGVPGLIVAGWVSL